jgi:hypothetical protein
LNQFLLTISSSLDELVQEQLLFTHGLFAYNCGVDPRAIDQLIAYEHDAHYLTGGVTRTTWDFLLLLQIITSHPIAEDINIIDIPGKNTSIKLLKLLRRADLYTLDERLKHKGRSVPFYLKSLQSDIDQINWQKGRKPTYKDIQEIFVTIFTGYPVESIKELIDFLKEFYPQIELETGAIPLLAPDINQELINKKRADLLLKDRDLLTVKQKLQQNRLATQQSNSTVDVIRIMQEVFEERELMVESK